MANPWIAFHRRTARGAGVFTSLVLLAVLALGGVSCSSTKVVSFSNTRVTANAPVTNIVTIMVDPRSMLRASVENHMAMQLAKRGVTVHASYTKFSLEELQGNQQRERQDLSVWGTDAVLVCRLTDRTDISEPPEFRSSTADWNQVWSASTRSTEFEADAWGGEVKVTAHLEGKLYRLSNSQLLWAGYAEAKLGELTDDVKVIQAICGKIVGQLAQDGMIR